MSFPPITPSIPALVMALLLSANCSGTPKGPIPDRYESSHRCGGIEPPWLSVENVPQGDRFIRNKVQISQRGRLSWNGMAINEATLERYAVQSSRMSPPPELDLVIENDAPCSEAQIVRQMLPSYCGNSTCIEFAVDEWTKYSAPFVVYAPPDKR